MMVEECATTGSSEEKEICNRVVKLLKSAGKPPLEAFNDLVSLYEFSKNVENNDIYDDLGNMLDCLSRLEESVTEDNNIAATIAVQRMQLEITTLMKMIIAKNIKRICNNYGFTEAGIK